MARAVPWITGRYPASWMRSLSRCPTIRELDLGNTPYDGANSAEQADFLRQGADNLYPSSTLTQEEEALKRMGLLGNDDDLAALLDKLYGQDLPITYLPLASRLSVLESIDKLNLPQRAEAAREFGQAAVHQAFGADAGVVDDPTNGDAVLAAARSSKVMARPRCSSWSAAERELRQSGQGGWRRRPRQRWHPEVHAAVAAA